MPRYVVVADESQVWIDCSSSVHPVRATATGLAGWVTLATTTRGVAKSPAIAGEICIEVGRLRSGNPLIDRETRRRIDAEHHPEIVGTITAGERIAPDRLHVTGTITFRRQVQDVIGELTVGLDADRVTFDGSATFDVRAWGLQPPRVALLQVHPEVDVRIHVVAAGPSASQSLDAAGGRYWYDANPVTEVASNGVLQGLVWADAATLEQCPTLVRLPVMRCRRNGGAGLLAGSPPR